MKYEALKTAKRENVFCENLLGGIDTQSGENKIENHRFKSLKNVYFKNGKLCTRKALASDLVFNSVISEALPLTVTETTYFIGKEKYNFAYCSSPPSLESNKIDVMLVGKGDSVLNIGTINIGNSQPDSVMFFISKPIKTGGSGIFAFLCVKNLNTDVYLAYEYVSSQNKFLEIEPKECYIPTVYMFGKGNEFPEELKDDEYFKTPSVKVEQENLLNHYFKSYYTTDGYSYSFSLPIRSICTTETVTVTIYKYKGSSVSFSFQNGETSKTFYLGSLLCEAEFDYDLGEIYFYCGGVQMAIPAYPQYGNNNLEIIACNKNKWEDISVISSTGVVAYNSRMYFYGNKANPNTVYSSRESDSLYVPKSSKIAVGSPLDSIKKLGIQNGKVIVFKSGEIHKINVTAAGFVSETVNTLWGSEDFIIADTLKDESISTKTGCVYAETVASIGGQLIWLGTDRKVYTLEATTYGSEKNIICISNAINNILSEISDSLLFEYPPIGFASEGLYYLYMGGKIFVCDCKIREYGFPEKYANFSIKDCISWYVWELPESLKLISGRDIDGTVLLSCLNDSRYFFAHLRDEFSDSYYIQPQGTLSPWLHTSDIITEAITKTFDFGGMESKKIIDKIFVSLKTNGKFNIKFISDKGEKVFHFHGDNTLKNYTVIPPKENVKTVSLQISGEKDFELSDIKINCRKV